MGYTMKRIKFKLEFIGAGPTIEDAWKRGLAAYYLQYLKGSTIPPVPTEYELLDEFPISEDQAKSMSVSV